MTPQEPQRHTPLQAPQRLFAEHAASRVPRRHGQAVIDPAQGICRASGAQGGGAGLEPQQPIARIHVAQSGQHVERVVPALLTVVEEDQREARLGPDGAGARRRLFHHLQAACAVAIEARHVRHHARRQAQARHHVAVRPENQARVGIVGRDGTGLFGGLVRSPRRPEGASHPPFDSGRPGRLQAECGAEIVEGTTVSRVASHLRLGTIDRCCQIA